MILDARSGYWNVRLDDESSLLTTFNTPFSRNKWNHLAFGLVCAHDVFQKKFNETFGDIPGITGTVDDVIIAGIKDDGSDHDENLRAVLEHVHERNARFNEGKMVVWCMKIPYFGYLIGSGGVEPDPSKIAAIQTMTVPTNIQDLQSFVGMMNYLSWFTPWLASLTASLRDLCNPYSNGVLSMTGHPRMSRERFLQLHSCITTTKRSHTNFAGCSKRGLGAAVLQEAGPVAFASKSLSEAERQYSNIKREGEMLGIGYGLERFHYYAYMYGRRVTIETGHKPLVSIMQKTSPMYHHD